jgi:hypothetical protein
MKAVSNDGLDFKLFFSINDVRWWAWIVISILLSFMVRSQQASVEDVMDSPGRGQCELIRHWRYHFDDFEGSMTFGHEFQ